MCKLSRMVDETRQLHAKIDHLRSQIDHLRSQDWERRFDIQASQIELLRDMGRRS